MILTKGSFDIHRATFGKLNQSQVDGFNFLVSAFDKVGWTYPQAAYALATVWHETAGTMQPIKERGSDAYLKSKRYYPYIGYGYVQLTWKENYIKVGKLIGVDLVNKPELALNHLVAADILTGGMAKGWFTGRGFHNTPLGRYNRANYIAARRIINGTDKAAKIADEALVFEKALRSP